MTSKTIGTHTHPRRPLWPTLLLVCCGPATAPPAQATAPAATPPATTAAPLPAPARAPTAPALLDHVTVELGNGQALRRGHYSAETGLFGLVLDRSGAIPLARRDGEPIVLELAVRKLGDGNVALISARGDLVVNVDRHGRLTISSLPGASGGDGRRPVRLLRDGEGDALAGPPLPSVDATLATPLASEVSARCGTTVSFDLDPSGPEAVRRGILHGAHRTARALTTVCRDASGRTAVSKKLAAVRLRAKPGDRSIRIEGKTLSIEAPFDDEGFGPFVDEIQRLVEGQL